MVLVLIITIKRMRVKIFYGLIESQTATAKQIAIQASIKFLNCIG